ncbi:MAG: hypothetical protein JHC87_07355 [Thermoleophilaceae bacterium]|nr:hypothetical protein [Thermoleophilaceae bacterium]
MDRLAIAALLVGTVVVLSFAFRWASNRRHSLQRIDPAEFDGGTDARAVVIFTSPYCHGCKQWIEQLGDAGVVPIEINLGERPEAAAQYKIHTTPRVAVVRTVDGDVLREFTHYAPRAHDVDSVVALVTGT